jgi:hypothetical protein
MTTLTELITSIGSTPITTSYTVLITRQVYLDAAVNANGLISYTSIPWIELNLLDSTIGSGNFPKKFKFTFTDYTTADDWVQFTFPSVT